MTLTNYPIHDVTLIEGPDHSFRVASVGLEPVVYKNDGTYEPWYGQEIDGFDLIVLANVAY